MISKFLAALIAWFYGTPRAFDAPVGPRFDAPSVTLPEGGPYRSPGAEPCRGVVLFDAPPSVPHFDAKAARKLSAVLHTCPDDVFEKALKDIETEARKGKLHAVVKATPASVRKDLKRRLEARGFKTLESSDPEWLLVKWDAE